jgi:hypothetical protein
VNGKRDDHRPLGILQPVPVRLGDLEVIGHLVELLASHVEGRVVINLHRVNSLGVKKLVLSEIVAGMTG